MAEHRTKLKKMRRTIGRNLLDAANNIPQASGYLTADVTEMRALQAKMKAEGKRASDALFLLKACVVALEQYPEFNCRQDGEEVLSYDEINGGVAVAGPMGLMVVTVPELNGNSFAEMSEKFHLIMDKVKTGRLTMDDMTKDTFTISVLSKTKMEFFTSIVNNHECFILGMGGVTKQPKVMPDGSIRARDLCKLIVTVNHTLTDGATINKLMDVIVEVLENPQEYID